MLSDAQKKVIRLDLKRLKLGKDELAHKPNLKHFMLDVNALVVDHHDFQQAFTQLMHERGHRHVRNFHKRLMRLRLAHRAAWQWGFHDLPKPRPSDDTPCPTGS